MQKLAISAELLLNLPAIKKMVRQFPRMEQGIIGRKVIAAVQLSATLAAEYQLVSYAVDGRRPTQGEAIQVWQSGIKANLTPLCACTSSVHYQNALSELLGLVDGWEDIHILRNTI